MRSPPCRVLPAFALGVLGSLAGATCGAQLLRSLLVTTFAADGLKCAAALAAKNIGGGLNFVAVAAALRLSPTTMAIALTADNILALVYFPLCAALGKGLDDPLTHVGPSSEISQPAAASDQRDECEAKERLSAAAESTPTAEAAASRCFPPTCALAIACAVVSLSLRVSPPGYDVPVATLLMVALATAFPAALKPLTADAEVLGTLLLYLFFASAGWTGGALGLSCLASRLFPLLAFLGVLYTVHLAVVLGGGALLEHLVAGAGSSKRFPRALLLAASNACIGGPATASALAVGNGWPSLVVPAVLVGNLGYMVATFLGIALHRFLS